METLQRTANRGSVSTGFNVDNSSLYEADDSSYIRFTNISTYASSARKKKFSMSMWFKLAEVGRQQMLFSTAANGYLVVQASGVIKWQQTYSGVQKTLNTNRVFRDTGAWYHVLIVVDTAQSTEADRTKLYVNGEQITDFSSATYPSQGDEAQNVYEQHNYIGTWGGGDHTNTGLSGYVSEFYFLSEIAPSPTDFGEFEEDTGIWIPKLYTAETISSPSSYLNFSNASNLAEATSGQDWASGNVNSVSQATDTCTNNFCTLNPLFMYSASSGANPIITEGATVLTTQNSGYWHNSVSTMAVTSGKWYFEAQPGTSSTHVTAIGYGDEEDVYTWGRASSHVGGSSTESNAYLGSDTAGSSYGRIFPANSSPSTRVNYTSSNIVGVAIDADNGYVYWSKDGTFINSGDPTSGSSGTGGYAVPTGTGTNGILIPAIAAYHHTSLGKILINFGGYTTISISSGASDGNGHGTFEYAPPSGYLALCTKNLASDGGSA